jgi:hypothetical protein
MLENLKPYLGMLIAGFYALLLRLIFGIDFEGQFFDLFSITFVWLTPIIIGAIPFLFASRQDLKSWNYRITQPIYAVLVFFFLCFMTRIEDLICLVVLAIPYCLAAMIGGFLLSALVMKFRDKKGQVYSIFLIPFIFAPLEQSFTPANNSFSVSTKIIINANPEIVWQNIIRVRQIEDTEYREGFFNYAGIPRPLYAELDKDSIGATRIGHFEGGLKFVEKVSSWNKNKEIRFNIMVVPSTIRHTVFDQHILKGNHFKFLNAKYQLNKLTKGQTELILTSSYELNTNINSYASLWGNEFLIDFQERLLEVIKTRCEDSVIVQKSN